MLVVAEDLFGGSGISDWQRGTPFTDRLELAAKRQCMMARGLSRQPLAQRIQDRFCEGLAGLRCKLMREPVCVWMLDVERHLLARGACYLDGS